MSSHMQVELHSLGRIPPLPAELTDTIIDCLAADTPRSTALKAATLVCKTWSTRAQYHLFRSMTWKLNFDARVAQGPVATFASSGVKKYVQHITLRLFVTTREWYLPAVCLFLCHFCAVRSVALTATPPVSALVTTPLARALVIAFPDLRALTLKHVRFGRSSEFLGLGRGFKALVSLELGVTRTNVLSLSREHEEESDVLKKYGVKLLPSLQFLAITEGNFYLPTLFRILLGPNWTTNLRHLILQTSTTAEVNTLLSSGAFPSLRDLKIHVTRGALPKLTRLDLQNCGSVVNLEFGDKYSKNYNAMDELEWVGGSIASLPPACALRALTVIILLSAGLDVEMVSQQTLSAANVPSMSDLRKLTLHLATAASFHEMADLFRPVMKQLAPKAEIVIEDAKLHHFIPRK